MSRLIRSRIQCFWCGDVIESKHRQDFRTCRCQSLSIDGGLDYQRILFNDEEPSWKDLSEYAED